jgi:hypothetical protein
MKVRLVVRVTDRALVHRLAHATRHEPVAVDAGQGTLAFDVPFRRVEAVLDCLAKYGAGDFLAHLTPIQKSHGSPGEK